MAEEKRKWTSYRLSGDTISKFKSRVGDTPNYDSTKLRSQVTEAGLKQMNERKKAEAAAEKKFLEQEEELLEAEEKAYEERDREPDLGYGGDYSYYGTEEDLWAAEEEERIMDEKAKIHAAEQKKADDAAKKAEEEALRQEMIDSGELTPFQKSTGISEEYQMEQPIEIDYDRELHDATNEYASVGTAGTRELQKKYEVMLRDLKNNFLNSDTAGKNDALASMGKLGTSVKSDISAGGTIDTLHGIIRESGLGNETPDYVKGALAQILRGKINPGATEDDSMYYSVVIPGNAALPSNTPFAKTNQQIGEQIHQELIIDNTWLNDIAVNYTYPHQREKDFTDALTQMETQGRSGGTWNDEGMQAQTAKMITKDNLASCAMNPTWGSQDSLAKEMMHAGVIPHMPDSMLTEYFSRVSQDDELFSEMKRTLVQGIVGKLKERYDVGYNLFEKENEVAEKTTGTEGMNASQRKKFYLNKLQNPTA